MGIKYQIEKKKKKKNTRLTGLFTELRGFYKVAKSQFQIQFTKMANSNDTGLEHAYLITYLNVAP